MQRSQSTHRPQRSLVVRSQHRLFSGQRLFVNVFRLLELKCCLQCSPDIPGFAKRVRMVVAFNAASGQHGLPMEFQCFFVLSLNDTNVSHGRQTVQKLRMILPQHSPSRFQYPSMQLFRRIIVTLEIQHLCHAVQAVQGFGMIWPKDCFETFVGFCKQCFSAIELQRQSAGIGQPAHGDQCVRMLIAQHGSLPTQSVFPAR